jgi:inner membrane protein YidH
MREQWDTALRDRLAVQRTELANERTLLSYVRTALGLIAIGVPAVWWFEDPVIQALGVLSLIMGLGFVAIGTRRFLRFRAEINRQSG